MKRLNIKDKVQQAYHAALSLGLPNACPKVPFTKASAEVALKKATESNKRNRKECRIYQCDTCGMWHLTSQKKEDVQVENYRVVNKAKWEELMKGEE
jgi:hypothetical protein